MSTYLYNSTLQQSIVQAQSLIGQFILNPDIDIALLLAFGNTINLETAKSLLLEWSSTKVPNKFPNIQIKSREELKGASGAYSRDNNTIYLAEDLFKNSLIDLQALTGVLLEELGHSLDAKANTQDAPGDEGAIFAALIQGKTLTDKILADLKTEDDTATITIDSTQLIVEQASPGVDPGNSLSTAFNMGFISGIPARIYDEFVGSTDREDYYSFQISTNSYVSFYLDRLVDYVRLDLYYDANTSLTIDYGETIFSEYDSNLISKTLPLGTGKYYVRVSTPYSGDNTQYTLTLSQWNNPGTTFSDPGNTLATAYNLGNLTTTQTYTDFVGTADRLDYYRFNLTGHSLVTLNLTGIEEYTQLRIIYDTNNNGIIDYREDIYTDWDSDFIAGTKALGIGQYFVEVYSYYNSNNTNYTLNLSQTLSPISTYTDPGNNIATAYNLGNIVGTRTLNQFVGSADPSDFYKFSLVEPTNLIFNLRGLSDDTYFQLIYDANNNGNVDYGDSLYSDWDSSFMGSTKNLNAGTYYVKIAQDSANDNSNYTLELKGSPDPKPDLDLNGDFKTDVIAHNLSQNWNNSWLMNGSYLSEYKSLPSWSGWKPVATGDFNWDGWSDIVVTNPSTGWNALWIMNNGSLQWYTGLPSWGADWKIVDTGDFNGDQQTDILLNNSVQGWSAVWLMYGTTYINSRSTSFWPGWQTIGAGDMNNDGVTDILIRNNAQGWNNVHLMNKNNTIKSSPSLPSWSGWNIVGTADFGKDGFTDILVNNPSTNWNNIWHMGGNGTQFATSENFPSTWSGWEVIL